MREALLGALLSWVRIVEQIGIPLGVSILYFALLKSRPPRPRLLASAHGVSFLFAFALVWLLGEAGADPSWLRTAFYALTALGVASTVYSLLQRAIPPIAHLAQVLNLSHALMFVYLAELAFDA